jgi:hypothetical protein
MLFVTKFVRFEILLMPEKKVNFSYLVTIYFVCLTTALQVGLTLGSYGTAGNAIASNTDGWQGWYNALIPSMGVFGLTVGSLLAERFVHGGRV